MDYEYKDIEEKFKSLPREIQVVMTSPETTKSIEEIAKTHNLFLDQESALYDTISYTLLGLISSKDFVAELSKNAEIKPDQAIKIATEVNGLIFSKIKTAMRESQENATENQNTEKIIAESSSKMETNHGNDQVGIETKPTHITDLEKAGGFTIEHENSSAPHETSSDGLGSDVLRVAQVRDRWSPLQQTVIPKSAEGIDQAPISMPRTFTKPAVQTPAPEPVKEEPVVVKTPISITMPPAMPAIDIVPPQAQREPIKTETEVIQKEKVDVVEIPKQKEPLADELLSILNKTKGESATIKAVPEIVKEEPVSTVPANLPIEEDTPPIKSEITSIPEPIVTAQPVVPEPEPVIVKPEPIIMPEPIIAKPEPVTIPEPVKAKEPEIVPEPIIVKPPVIVWKSEPLTPPVPAPEPEKAKAPEPPPIPVTPKPSAEVKKVAVPPAKPRTFDPYRESVS